jgi:hypothetical protein
MIRLFCDCGEWIASRLLDHIELLYACLGSIKIIKSIANSFDSYKRDRLWEWCLTRVHRGVHAHLSLGLHAKSELSTCKEDSVVTSLNDTM